MSWLSFPLSSSDAGPSSGVSNSGPAPKLIEPGSVAVCMMLEESFDRGVRNLSLRKLQSKNALPRPTANAPFEENCFNVVHPVDSRYDRRVVVEINSKHLKSICRRLMGDQISWRSSRLRIEPIEFFPFYYGLRDYLQTLKAEAPEAAGTQHLELLLSFLYVEHFTLLWELEDLTNRGEITFDLLNCILLPGTILFTLCLVTGEPLACRLVKLSKNSDEDWLIEAAYVEVKGNGTNSPAGPPFGHAKLALIIKEFKGIVPICSLAVYPLKMHPREPELREQLIARGRAWEALAGVYHKRYDGVAYKESRSSTRHKALLLSSRVIIDRMRYELKGHSLLPRVVESRDVAVGSDSGDDYVAPDPYPTLIELSDEDAMMTPAFVYGFSLENKRWLQLKVKHITDINWREDAFDRLVLPSSHKTLIKHLVEAQVTRRACLEDVVEGKGRGLVLNLSGPAGVGKTLTAEAASEHLRLPLYVVGSGDLGTSPSELDRTLKEIFQLSSAWGAVVVIDEADVYLEQRSAHDQQRNALVSVFLRQLEYFNGVLFLTTNRVRTFDTAFQSRIHVSLHYPGLDVDARRALWRGFVGDVGGELSHAEEIALAAIPLNGRQIKNTVRTASMVASGANEGVSYEHLKRMVDIAQQFEEHVNGE